MFERSLEIVQKAVQYQHYIYIYMCVCVCICMYVCMHAWMYVCMYVCVYIYMHMDVDVDASRQARNTFIIHMYIYIYIHICTYTQLNTSQEMDGEKSKKALPAIVESMDPKKVGVRRIGLRFLDDGVLQWVPADWLTPAWNLGLCAVLLVIGVKCCIHASESQMDRTLLWPVCSEENCRAVGGQPNASGTVPDSLFRFS